MARIYNDILETIGRTPLVRAPRFSEGLDAELVFKLESFNPCWSVKDRIARFMIQKALGDGALHPGDVVVESSSGNMEKIQAGVYTVVVLWRACPSIADPSLTSVSTSATATRE